MKHKAARIEMLTLLLISTLTLVSTIRSIVAKDTIYVRSDGSVVDTDKIQRYENLYVFTDNIYEPIRVERSSIVVDGEGYDLKGTQAMNGLILVRINNVTIKNTNITSWSSGAILFMTSNCTICGNNIRNNLFGVHFPNSSNFNTISGNDIDDNGAGIWLDYFSNHNTIFGNNMINNIYGIYLASSDNNNVSANTVASSNQTSVWIVHSSNSQFYHNKFLDNSLQVSISENHQDHHPPPTNIWDNGFEGNYWSDYEERHPDANEIDGSGIWETPYLIDENNVDNCPLVPEFPTFTPVLVFIVLTVIGVIYKRRFVHASGSHDERKGEGVEARDKR